MPAIAIVRPVWRRFKPLYFARAALHVRGGGHAAIVDEGGGVDLLLCLDRAGKITEAALWSLLAIEQRRWRRVKSGDATGLATARVQPDFIEAVLDWCERDATHAGPTRRILLDCMACAACCREANVLLGEVDLERWRDAGRPELAARSYVRRARDGKITLRLSDSGRCQHLRRDRRCGIYELRPDNCRAFPAGTEACLAAREDTLGLRDG